MKYNKKDTLRLVASPAGSPKNAIDNTTNSSVFGQKYNDSITPNLRKNEIQVAEFHTELTEKTKSELDSNMKKIMKDPTKNGYLIQNDRTIVPLFPSGSKIN